MIHTSTEAGHLPRLARFAGMSGSDGLQPLLAAKRIGTFDPDPPFRVL
jgi:hypothetical protein